VPNGSSLELETCEFVGGAGSESVAGGFVLVGAVEPGSVKSKTEIWPEASSVVEWSAATTVGSAFVLVSVFVSLFVLSAESVAGFVLA
jgi:hypothetical protein